MSVDDLPDLNPPDHGHVVDPSRPILSFAWHMPRAHRAAAHHHPRGHIIHPTAGSFWVETSEGRWLVPTGQAIWVPPHVHHEVVSPGPVSARMIFVDPSATGSLPPRACTVRVSPLLAALLARTVQYGNDYPSDGPAANLARVMLDELAAMAPAPLLLPMARDPRLARAVSHLLDDPASAAGLDALARHAGASPRTLARLFRQETGMSFGDWRTRQRLIASVERLAAGARVTEVALDLGYRSTSSFVYMFRRHMGEPPGRFRGGRDDDGTPPRRRPDRPRVPPAPPR
jgi:AraC-like DNA-binding protein